MSGLADKIPGLTAHRIDIPQKTAPVFDQAAASLLVGDAVSIISSLYPAGALEWLRANRPDVSKHLREAADAMDVAANGTNRAALVLAIERWVEFHRKAFAIYQGRPPLIDCQEGLFS